MEETQEVKKPKKTRRPETRKQELERLHKQLAEQGGRGVELAERIDALARELAGNPFRRMSSDDVYEYIVERFLKREPVDPRVEKSVIAKDSGRGGGGFGGRGWYGGARMSVQKLTGALLSYRMPIAAWVGDFLLVNGDTNSTETRKHQEVLRRGVKKFDIPHTIVPFSILEAAGIHNMMRVQLVATTPDRDITKDVRWTFKAKTEYAGSKRNTFGHIKTVQKTIVHHCHAVIDQDGDGVRSYAASSPDKIPEGAKHCDRTDTHEHLMVETQHFLGETLFKVHFDERAQWNHEKRRDDILPAETRYYVCGLDRNDKPWRRKYYLARLPVHVGHSEGRFDKGTTTVDMALDMLKPEAVVNWEWQHKDKVAVPRQGEWFFLPASAVQAATLDGVKEKHWLKQVPIVADTPEQIADSSRVVRSLRGAERRHVAHRMQVIGNIVFVKGPVKDAEHDTLHLDGWHMVVKNLADGSWAMAKGRPAVD